MRLLPPTILSAVLYGLAFPPHRMRALGWLALVPLLLAVRQARLRTALGLAWVWTIVAAAVVGSWFPTSIAGYYQQGAPTGIAFFVGVTSAMAAIEYMAFAACYRILARRPGPLLPLLTAAAWVAAELGRVRLHTGNPWALLGYSQIGLLPLMQVADLAGVYGMSFTLAATNAALAELWAARRNATRRGPALGGVLATAAVVALVFAYGELRLRSALASATPVTMVGLVQGNLDVGSQWREDFYGQNLDTYVDLTDQLLHEAGPAVVFWPENALTFFLADEPLYRAVIGRVLSASGTQLVTGGPRASGAIERRYYNSVFLLSPAGEILATYDKQRLVPFAEYFPFARLDFLRRHFARVRVFTAGDAAPLLPTAIGPAGVTICNEAMFPDVAAARVRAGATYLVDPANDTWLSPDFSEQQFDIVVLRAVEQRRWLVRASTSGPSAIVDPLGRIPVRTGYFTRTVVAGGITPRTELSLYCRVGDLFALACGAAALAGWLRRGIVAPPTAT